MQSLRLMYHTHIGPSNSVPKYSNCFLCAYEFISDDIIHQSLALAQTKVEEHPTAPPPCAGRLSTINTVCTGIPMYDAQLSWPWVCQAKYLIGQGVSKE